MHNHNNKGDGFNGMMWMIIPCLLLFGVLVFGGEKLSSSGYFWPIFIGVFVVAHFWMMFKGHGNHKNDDVQNETDDISIKQPETKNEDNKSKSGGCCH